MMRTVDSVDELKRIAVRVRVEIIKMIGAAGSGHPGGSLSAVELLVALYFRVLRHDPQNPSWPDRDRFILSKGHGCPVLYATYAEAGYIDPALLSTLRKLGSRRWQRTPAPCTCAPAAPKRQFSAGRMTTSA
jgi:transketolase